MNKLQCFIELKSVKNNFNELLLENTSKDIPKGIVALDAESTF